MRGQPFIFIIFAEALQAEQTNKTMIRTIALIGWMLISGISPASIHADTPAVSVHRACPAVAETLIPESIALPPDTLYTHEAEELITQRRSLLIKRMAITICILTSILLSASLLLWLAWRHMRALSRGGSPADTRRGSLPHDCAPPAPEEAEAARRAKQAETEAETETDSYLFKRIERLVKDEKLYLNPDLSRQDILDRLSINKNLFSSIMQKHLQMTLPEYLSHLRVQHAIQLMDKQPHFTAQALAEESGFKNLRNLQRNFKSVTGMTFSEFRESRNGGGKIH